MDIYSLIYEFIESELNILAFIKKKAFFSDPNDKELKDQLGILYRKAIYFTSIKLIYHSKNNIDKKRYIGSLINSKEYNDIINNKRGGYHKHSIEYINEQANIKLREYYALNKGDNYAEK